LLCMISAQIFRQNNVRMSVRKPTERAMWLGSALITYDVDLIKPRDMY
jgi:hypothetical protein